MHPTFLLDENVDVQTKLILKKYNCVALICPKSISDHEAFEIVKKKHLILLTFDRDFENSAIYKPDGKCGIIVLHIHPPHIAQITAALERLFSHQKPKELLGKITLLTKDAAEVSSE